MKKLFFGFCCFLMIFFLSACSFIVINNKNESEDSEVSDEGESENEYISQQKKNKEKATELLNEIKGHEFENTSFTVATTPDVIFAPNMAQDGYEEALMARNGAVEKKFSISIGQVETPLDLMLSDSYSSYLSGLYYSDAMIIPASSLGSFVEKGFLLNVYSLPFCDFDREYFDREAMDQAAAGNNAYAIMGSVTKDIGSYYCIYLNVTNLDEETVSNLYSLVKKGEWTWDEFYDFQKRQSDINGNAYIGLESGKKMIDAVYKSGGGYYMKTGLGYSPYVSYDKDLLEKCIEIATRQKDMIVFSEYLESGSILTDFQNGGLLSCIATVSDMETISKTKESWTLLPVPKVDREAKEYMTMCRENMPVMVISSGNPYPEDCSYAVSALGAASYKTLDDAYYDRLIRVALNNSKTLDMLDYVCGIKSGKGLCDFTFMFDNLYPALDTYVSSYIWDSVCRGNSDVFEMEAAAAKKIDGAMKNAFVGVYDR